MTQTQEGEESRIQLSFIQFLETHKTGIQTYNFVINQSIRFVPFFSAKSIGLFPFSYDIFDFLLYISRGVSVVALIT